MEQRNKKERNEETEEETAEIRLSSNKAQGRRQGVQLDRIFRRGEREKIPWEIAVRRLWCDPTYACGLQQKREMC